MTVPIATLQLVAIPPPPLANDADSAARAEIEPTGWNVDNALTTLSGSMGPPACRRPAVPSAAMLALPTEDPAPDQSPTLTELEEARAGVDLARQVEAEWLMLSWAPEPDVGELLGQLVNRPAWHALGNCRGAGPGLFFPLRTDGPPVAALALCAKCTVRQKCLDSALQVGSTSGIWAGRRAGSAGACGVGRWREVRVQQRAIATWELAS